MSHLPRLLTATLLTTAGLFVVAGPASADLTLPSPLPTVSVPVAAPTLATPTLAVPSLVTPSLPEPVASAVAQVTATPPQRPAAGATSAPSLPVQLPSAMPTSLAAVPGLPALPGSGGSGPTSAPDDQSGTPASGPLGDDLLPAALEDQLCAVLAQVMAQVPAEISGLPAGVIAQLPRAITDQVPADVLRVVTLRCPPTAAAAERQAAAAAPVRQLSSRHRTAASRARTGLAALPHTGLLAAVPVAGLGLLVTGLLLRRRTARP
jgi:hypothetical protein